MRRILLIIILFFSTIQAFSYDISIFRRRTMIREQKMWLFKMYGKARITIDTADYDKLTRSHIFAENEHLEPGFYEVHNASGESFEFVIDSDSIQKFSITVDFDPFGKNPVFNGSQVNQDYVNLLDKTMYYGRKMRYYDSIVKANSHPDAINPDTILAQQNKLIYNQHIDSLGIEKQVFRKKYPKSIISYSFKLVEPLMVLLPDTIAFDTTTPRNIWEQKKIDYFIAHCLDSIEFYPSYVANLPMFLDALQNMMNFFSPTKNNIKYALTTILNKARASDPKVFRYLLEHFTKIFTSNVQNPIFDSINVEIQEQYLPEAVWLTPAGKRVALRKLDKMKDFLYGMRPPEMYYPDTNNIKQTGFIHSIFGEKDADYTIIVFFEPGCPHCNVEVPKLNETAKKYKNVEIVAVASDPNVENVKAFIRNHKITFQMLFGGSGAILESRDDMWEIDMVPSMFILDKNKRILKKLLNTTEAVEQALDSYK